MTGRPYDTRYSTRWTRPAYRHLVTSRLAVPSAGVSRIGGRPTTRVSTPSAMGFVTAVVLVTIAMVLSVALVATAPHTVMVPLAMVLGLGLIASGVAAVRERRLGLRRRARHERP